MPYETSSDRPGSTWLENQLEPHAVFGQDKITHILTTSWGLSSRCNSGATSCGSSKTRKGPGVLCTAGPSTQSSRREEKKRTRAGLSINLLEVRVINRLGGDCHFDIFSSLLHQMERLWEYLQAFLFLLRCQLKGIYYSRPHRKSYRYGN